MEIMIAIMAMSCVTTSITGMGIVPSKDKVPSPSVRAESTSSVATSTESIVESTTFSAEQEKDCRDQIGTIQNDVPVNTMRKYDVEKILEELGGAAGKVNTTWNKDAPSPSIENVDIKMRPLPDTENSTFWIYNYRQSDFKSYVRLEHALLRFKGSAEEFVDVRGELFWTPPDFCNRQRHAFYQKDDTGFHVNVSLEYCYIGSEILQCQFPANCYFNETSRYCVAAPSSALLASLVG